MEAIKFRVKLFERGMKAKDLAKATGGKLSPPVLSNILTGKVIPSRENMQMLCDLLECDAKDLFDANEINLLDVTAKA